MGIPREPPYKGDTVETTRELRKLVNIIYLVYCTMQPKEKPRIE
jgi:hypothetical protein